MSKHNDDLVIDTVSTALGAGVGVAVSAGILAAGIGAAPVAGGAALTWALKRIGFGAARRGAVVLTGAGIASGKGTEVATKAAIRHARKAKKKARKLDYETC